MSAPIPQAVWLHRAAPDSPRVNGRRLRYGAWYLLAGSWAAPEWVAGPHVCPEAAWEQDPARITPVPRMW